MSPKKPTEKGVRGSRHAPPTNAFPKGGPPGPGRPKLTDEEREARDLVRSFQPEAVRLLIGHARDEEDKRLSMDALKHLTQWLQKLQLEVGGPDGGPVRTFAIDPKSLSGEQLDVLLGIIPADQDE